MDKIKERFKDHVLTEILNTDKIKVFEFRNKNGLSNCYQRWIIDRGTLIVTGDNYSSIYKWNDSNITLDFLSKCNLGYFNEKCLADKDGSNQRVFDDTFAENYLKEIAVERIYDNGEDEIEIKDDDWAKMDLSDKLKVVTPIICRELEIDEDDVESLFYNENIQDAYSMLNDNDNEFMFGIDGWEYSSGIKTYTMTPKMHLAALRVANDNFPNTF